jgi:lon-related putative ATP-dependent protease
LTAVKRRRGEAGFNCSTKSCKQPFPIFAPMTVTGLIEPLAAAQLCRRCQPEQFAFETTDQLEAHDDVLGQVRAIDAMRFGVGIRRDGYNLFAMGPSGVGRHTIVRRQLEKMAGAADIPSDWCYVFNFDLPHKPRKLQFPAGQAAAFAAKMERLVEDLRAAISAAFEADEYRNRRDEIERELGERQEKAIETIGERAKEKGIGLLRTPSGFGFAPLRKDKVISPHEWRELPEAEQTQIQTLIVGFQEELEHAIRAMPKWRREALEKVRELNRQVTRAAVNNLIEDLKAEYRELPQVLDYLGKVQEDVFDHAEMFRHVKEGETAAPLDIPLPQAESADPPFRRYAVNVLIDHSGSRGAPIVYEDNPSHDALLGRIEYVAHMGALLTDFTLIKAGALHRANGGYLVLDVLRVLTQPFAWDALKRSLRAAEIRIQSLGHELSLISTVSLEPEPIPLNVKIVLVGERHLYYLLHAYDPEFAELFKVAVDFEDDIARDAGSDMAYAQTIAAVARREKLRPLDRSGVARVIERLSREAGDAEKISVNMGALADLLRETDYWAGNSGRAVITGEDVRRAIEAQIARADRVKQKLQEHIQRGSLLIDTTGSRSGQVNGLAVLQLGGYSFGTPHRITARTRLGGGGVVDIERESEMGGPIHSKGVLILSGFLAGRYVVNKPLSVSASLVFEQSYGGVEGDSASSAELYALLSALADAPIRQSFAVTGSVNQHGEVQAIGGVNEKIEGFFEVCRARGLSGEQGVLIPESNVKNLMLNDEVVQAVADGRFAIYPIRHVDEGIALLTGDAAATIHSRVEHRLADYAERARSYAGEAPRKSWKASKAGRPHK